MSELYLFDNANLSESISYIAGIDEAGRGPLAGPVCAACVIMPYDNEIIGVNDSKKLSEKKREMLFDKIVNSAISYSIQLVDEKTIDKINILEATKLAMQRAVNSLSVKPDMVLIDAVKLSLPYKTKPIIRGDATSYAIACASILAKVYRDRFMIELDKKYPQYLFAKHKGYGTKVHIDLIKEYGPCEAHRKTFIKNFYEY